MVKVKVLIGRFVHANGKTYSAGETFMTDEGNAKRLLKLVRNGQPKYEIVSGPAPVTQQKKEA